MLCCLPLTLCPVSLWDKDWPGHHEWKGNSGQENSSVTLDQIMCFLSIRSESFQNLCSPWRQSDVATPTDGKDRFPSRDRKGNIVNWNDKVENSVGFNFPIRIDRQRSICDPKQRRISVDRSRSAVDLESKSLDVSSRSFKRQTLHSELTVIWILEPEIPCQPERQSNGHKNTNHKERPLSVKFFGKPVIHSLSGESGLSPHSSYSRQNERCTKSATFWCYFCFSAQGEVSKYFFWERKKERKKHRCLTQKGITVLINIRLYIILFYCKKNVKLLNHYLVIFAARSEQWKQKKNCQGRSLWHC